VLDGHADYRLRLDNLLDAEAPLDEGSHAQCPGHAACITEEWVQPIGSGPIAPERAEATQDDEEDDGWRLAHVAIYVCTDPDAHGHRSRYGSSRAAGGTAGTAEPDEVQKEAEKEKRRTTLANNKAWREAEPIRRDWLRALAARKTAPKGAAALITTALTTDSYTVRKAMEKSAPLAADLLGLGSREAVEQAAAAATDARALLISLLVVLAAYEDGTRVDTWRSPMTADRRYFGWLADNGYPLSDVEALAGPSTKGKRQ
jgi:ParB family transcriptional regulator, chromosome partitioning protein